MRMRPVRADLHNHLKTSSRMLDGDVTEAASVAFNKLGYGGVLGVINFNDDRYEKVLDVSSHAGREIGNATYFAVVDILVVKGQEVPTQQGHLLVIGIERNYHLKPYQSLEYTLDEADEVNAIKGADHPFHHQGLGPFLRENPKYIERFNFIETHNGEAAFSAFGLLPKYANEVAQDFYNEVKIDFPDIASISSSDGHSFREIGRSWTELYMPDNYSDLQTSEQVLEYLGRGLRARRHNFQTEQRKNSKLAALIHIGEVVGIIAFTKVPIIKSSGYVKSLTGL
jgi:predicted metal-dependent phosphoesterase TrpH